MKKRNIIILLIVVLIIINLLLLVLMLRKNNSKTDEPKTPTLEQYLNVKSLKIANPEDLRKMNFGKVARTDVLNYSNKYVTEFLPWIMGEVNKNVKFDSDYYKYNRVKIQKYSHIVTYEDFIDLVEKVKKSKINFENYTSIEYIKADIKENQLIIECKIYYEGGKTATLKITYIGTTLKETSIQF